MLRWLRQSQEGSVKPSKELISLPDQSRHRCMSATVPGCPAVLLGLPCNQSIISDTDSPRERTRCLLNSKGCSLQKTTCAGLPQFPYSPQALQAVCVSENKVLFTGIYYVSVKHQCLKMLAAVPVSQRPAAVPKHGRAVWRAATALEPVPPLRSPLMCCSHVAFHHKCQLPACQSGFLANIGHYSSALFLGLFFLSNPLSEIIVIRTCIKSKNCRTFPFHGKSLSSK